MKKNSFITFCCAFIPGAGQMYLGMMKRGVSIMLAFAVICAVSGFLYLPFLAVLLPVLWFYAFFDTWNIRAVPYEERVACDRFLFDLDGALNKDWMAIMKKRHVLAGVACIVLGVYLLYNAFLRPLLWRLEDYVPWLGSLLRGFPSFVVAIAVIALGVHLVFGGRGKKMLPPPQDDDYVEYGGNKHE